MNYTVNKLAKLSGVSIRTLRYYDEIGLLKPAFVGEQGYRFYQEPQLLILQQILFYRELGFELKRIQEILKQADPDVVIALQTQKKCLRTKITRMQTLMKTIDATINRLQGKQTMNDKELFKGFDVNSEQQKKYEKVVEEYLTKKYGQEKKEAMLKTNKDVSGWKKEEWDSVRKEADDMCKQLVSLLEKNAKPGSPEVQKQIRRHFEGLKKFWEPNKESYAGHADFIMETDLHKFYDAYHPQLAQFMADAIKIFAAQSL